MSDSRSKEKQEEGKRKKATRFTPPPPRSALTNNPRRSGYNFLIAMEAARLEGESRKNHDDDDLAMLGEYIGLVTVKIRLLLPVPHFVILFKMFTRLRATLWRPIVSND